MSITIQVNKKPDLAKCQMLCDDMLHEKLEKFELTKFVNMHSTNLLIGKPKSGKTSLMYSFLKSPKLLKKVYNKIYLFQPSASRASMKDKLFDKLPETQKFDELSYENLKYVLSEIKHLDDENVMILFDDMGAFLKNPETMKLFKELVYNRRHLHTSIFFLVQSWYSVPKDLRRLFSNIFVFKTSKDELTNIFDEVVEGHKDDMANISKIVYDKAYQYLFINTDTQRMFKGFDELIFSGGNV